MGGGLRPARGQALPFGHMSGANQACLADRFEHSFAEAGWAVCYDDARFLHRGDLVFGATFATGNNRTGVAHAAAGRRCAACDEASGWLPAAFFALVGEEFCGFFFRGTTDLTNHDDGLGLVVRQEHVQHVDVLGAFDWVAADAHSSGLAQTDVCGLLNRFVSQGAGAGHNAHGATFVDVAWHDADFAGVRCDHTWAVRTDQAGGRAFQRALYLHHVQHRNAFGDADDQFHFRIDGLED
mmetsp:Transcript_13470/g.21471  ORF Transcript_13470/g.21471 Transcript_13470/m.21471 type:complete len:239 (-) Transcript_13470:1763-2479(-)